MLDELIKDPLISYDTLASKVKLSKPRVWRLIKKYADKMEWLKKILCERERCKGNNGCIGRKKVIKDKGDQHDKNI